MGVNRMRAVNLGSQPPSGVIHHSRGVSMKETDIMRTTLIPVKLALLKLYYDVDWSILGMFCSKPLLGCPLDYVCYPV